MIKNIHLRNASKRIGRTPWWQQLFSEEYQILFRKSAREINRQVDFIQQHLGIPRGTKILDLGCGSGQHAIELANRGYKVVGVDISLELIQAAQQLSREKRVSYVAFQQGDMREALFKNEFLAVVSISQSIGYFSEEENAKVIRNIWQAIKPGGKIFIDVHNKEFLRDHLKTALQRRKGDVIWTEKNIKFDYPNGILQSEWILSKKRKIIKRIKPKVKIYSWQELKDLLVSCGFEIERIFGNYDGSKFSSRSPRIIIIANKRKL